MVNIHQAKTHLSKYIAKIEHGESVVICKRNIPIAEIRPLQHRLTDPRPVGLAKTAFNIPVSFFEPLPDDLINTFYPKS